MLLPIEITIFREITAPLSLIPIIASFIFTSNSFPINEGNFLLLNFSGGSPTSFYVIENLHFQLLTIVHLKVYCWYFPQKCAIAACVPYLWAYFPISSLTFTGKSRWYFLFSLHKFFNLVLNVDTSVTVTLSDVLTNWGIWTCDSSFSAFLLIKYEWASIIAMFLQQCLWLLRF